MNNSLYQQFAKAIHKEGVHWLLPQNLPDRWLNTIMTEDAAVLSKEKRGNYDGLVYAVLCLTEKKPVSMENFGSSATKEYLARAEQNMHFYIWVLSIEAMARMEREMKMPHFIPAIPYLLEHPFTVDNIFNPDTVRQIRHIVDQGPLKP